jgi:hypothetical protein
MVVSRSAPLRCRTGIVRQNRTRVQRDSRPPRFSPSAGLASTLTEIGHPRSGALRKEPRRRQRQRRSTPAEPFRPSLPRGHRIGRSGESEAVAALEGAGFRILARNYRSPFGEVDIVAEEGNVLVFVEVKTRSSLGYGLPRDAITAAKRR